MLVTLTPRWFHTVPGTDRMMHVDMMTVLYAAVGGGTSTRGDRYRKIEKARTVLREQAWLSLTFTPVRCWLAVRDQSKGLSQV